MNVRIVPRGEPQRTDLYGGIVPPVIIDRGFIVLRAARTRPVTIPLRTVAEILLDEEPGDWW